MNNYDEFILLPTSATPRFADIFKSYEEFKQEYGMTFPKTISDDDTEATSSLQILYYLLYAKYGYTSITTDVIEQFKQKLFGIIWQYGPTWTKRLDIQNKLRNISDDDLLVGAKAIFNHAYNPATDPNTQTLEELTYINDQNTTNYKKSKMDAYTQLWDLLATDVTDMFLDRFKPLFKKFVSPYTDLYVSEVDD